MTHPSSRRRALTVLAGAGATGALAVVVLPAARLVAGPAAVAGGERPWITVARLHELTEGKPARFRVIADLKDGYATARQQPLGQVWLIRKGIEVTAFTATCPHLGCTIDLASDQKHFYCPCHTSWFDLDGKKTEGKPNQSLRGLDPLPARVSADQRVEVQFLRFRAGTASAEVLG
ncbi:MAG: Rieske (2Fe-2S) protein [Myxococcales bacterium]|nr:Rieske (2Fe-2S) protein [Polyangiaceae bacterium]MDW8249069.1 Rieske (2Fe-2S) protein [Myxococcales bacterium]